jgi:hypothetical protein
MRAIVALAWHDTTCPEGPDCRSRNIHAITEPNIATTGILQQFLERLDVLAGRHFSLPPTAPFEAVTRA